MSTIVKGPGSEVLALLERIAVTMDERGCPVLDAGYPVEPLRPAVTPNKKAPERSAPELFFISAPSYLRKSAV